MERYAFSRIGSRPVSEVNSADVLEILTPIWHVKPETARAVRQRVRSVLEWAVAMEMRMDNPCDRVLPVLGPQGDIVQHMQALAHQDVAAAVESVRNSGSAAPAIKLALELLVLTAARSGEVRLATWDEMDVAGRVWTISATRMKAKREHRVPLCRRAVEILEAARTLGDSGSLVFPMRSGRPIAASTLPKMLRQHGIAAVAHGFRSSFRDWAAERVVEQKRSGWRNPRHAHDWMASLRRYAFPRIGRRPVSEVTSGDVLEILAPIWHVKARTARVVRQRIRTVLEWAVAMEFGSDNPCDRVGPVLGPQEAVVRHMRALPHREVASALRKVRASDAMPVAKLAFEFLVLTAARWGEVRWAEWLEIDPADDVWTVPETRMKAKREHRVPLCRRAMETLDEARTLDDGAARWVFTRGGGKPLADRQLRQLLQQNEIAAVPHGFRSSFRDWAAEETDHPREGVEAALAHVVQNKVEAGLPAHGPVRAPAPAHERLGRVSGGR